jgi:hypothetical protein
LEEVNDLELKELKQLVCERAAKEYDEKEAEYPVMAAFLRFSSGPGRSKLDRESLAAGPASDSRATCRGGL